MTKYAFVLAGAAIGVLAAAAPAAAVQPQFVTPAAQGPVGPLVYEVTYATSGRPQDGQGLPVIKETVVTIGNPLAVGAGRCNVQVEWRDWNNAFAGVSGPFFLSPGFTLEFTTVNAPGAFPTPYELNVFRNRQGPFEGHARVRSSCGAPLRIDAEVVILDASGGGYEIDPVKIVRLNGTVGD